MKFRYDIQGLRAIAVLLVFIFHLSPSFLRGGFIGVDIFFVISGFLVSSIILAKKSKNTFTFLQFYLSRLKRIVPVFVVVLIFIGFLGAIIFLDKDVNSLKTGLLQAIIFNSNNYLAGIDNYFGVSNQQNPLLHTWTLSVEMQFYLLLPLFLMYIKENYVTGICCFLIMSILGYSFINSTVFSNQQAMYFSLSARIPEFLIGTVFAIKKDVIKKYISKYQNYIAFISFIGLLVLSMFFDSSIIFPGLWVIIPCVFGAFLLVTTDSYINRFLSCRVFVYIGELSYSIYLWHWVVMAFLRYYLVRNDFFWNEIIAIIVCTYILSVLSFLFVEKRFKLFRNKYFAISSFVLILLFFGVRKSMNKMNEHIGKHIPELYLAPTFEMESHSYTFQRIGVLGKGNISDSLCLIGDSHALSYKGLFDEFGKKYNVSFMTISNDLYPLIGSLDRSDFKNDKEYSSFLELNRVSKDVIKKSKFIFISSLWWGDIKSLSSALEQLEKSLRENQKIVIVGDYPRLKANPVLKYRDYIRKDTFNYDNVEFNVLPGYVQELISKSPKTEYMDFNYHEVLSQLPFINDTLGYYDDSHLNAYGSRKLIRYLENNLVFFFKKEGILK